MKQRITYFLPEGNRVDPADIQVESDRLNFTKAHEAAEEWRLTLGLQDLPDEIQEILSQSHELHIRWSSPLNEAIISPLVSRLPTGLHVFFTPRSTNDKVNLCPLLKGFLASRSIKCDSIANTFSRPAVLSERFAASSTYQYYRLGSIDQYIGVRLLARLCDSKPPALFACKDQVQELENASYIDVDFDAISHALVFTAFWNPHRRQILPARRDQRPIRSIRAEDTIEVGVLQTEAATEPEELSLGGHLTMIGQSDHPSLTLFSFPSRHHPSPAATQLSFNASFQHPSGLHPKFEIKLQREHLSPPKDSCGLHAYWTLPSTLFIDRYQLSDPLFLESQNLIALRSLSGEQDLEAPEWVTQRWGSAALFELAVPSSPQSGGGDAEWKVTIPTHLRYLDDQKHDLNAPDKRTIDIPWPILFWACEAEEGLKMSTNPFDRVNLGYDGLFGPKTMFYHIPAAPSAVHTVLRITVPVLSSGAGQWIQVGTLLAVVVGFAFICAQLVRSTALRSRGPDLKHKKKT